MIHLSPSHTHSHTHILSLSLSLSHTHTNTSAAQVRDKRVEAAALDSTNAFSLCPNTSSFSAACSVLQCVAVCCRAQLEAQLMPFRSAPTLPLFLLPAACFSALQCVAVCCSVLRSTARDSINAFSLCPITSSFFAFWLCSVLQCVAVCCSVLQCVAVCCSVLQWVAVL